MLHVCFLIAWAFISVTDYKATMSGLMFNSIALFLSIIYNAKDC